jgi:hypothetical protein
VQTGMHTTQGHTHRLQRIRQLLSFARSLLRLVVPLLAAAFGFRLAPVAPAAAAAF